MNRNSTKKKKPPTTVQEIRKQRDWSMWRRTWRNPQTSQLVPEPPEWCEGKTWTSKNADTEPAKSRCSRQVEKRWSDERVICAQIDEREAANWQWMKPQENSEPNGAGSGKCRKNGDAAAYGRACGKNTRSRNLEVRTTQAVKARHLRMEIWWERNSRDSRVAQGDVSRTMRPWTRKIFKTLNVARDWEWISRIGNTSAP